MAMKWLTGEDRQTTYLLRLHLDDSQVGGDGDPLPGSVLELEWSKEQDLEVSKAEHWRLGEAQLAAQQVTPLVIED